MLDEPEVFAVTILLMWSLKTKPSCR